MYLNEYRKFRALEAAEYIGLSASTLAKMRLRGDGPVYSKAGPRIVLYDRADLEAWLAARKRPERSETMCPEVSVPDLDRCRCGRFDP